MKSGWKVFDAKNHRIIGSLLHLKVLSSFYYMKSIVIKMSICNRHIWNNHAVDFVLNLAPIAVFDFIKNG